MTKLEWQQQNLRAWELVKRTPARGDRLFRAYVIHTDIFVLARSDGSVGVHWYDESNTFDGTVEEAKKYCEVRYRLTESAGDAFEN